MTHDPVHKPAHYIGKSGRHLIEHTEAYRLGPALTQAVDYLVRAGRKTADPRQDLSKALWYVRRAMKRDGERVFGVPFAERMSAREIAEDYDLGVVRAAVLGELLSPMPSYDGLARAATWLEQHIERLSVQAYAEAAE